MPKDDRDILDILSFELEFVSDGGYGRSVKTPWKPNSIFQDSLSCLNYGYPYRAHPCSECHLIDFVPPEKRDDWIPCHHIPLNETGETVDTLEMEDDQQKMEKVVKEWLRAQIRRIEDKKAAALDG